MVQVLYSIAAIMLLGITVLNINTKIHGTQDRLMFNELALQMTSVGAEMLNEIGKNDFDPSTIFGEVLPRNQLSPDDGTWGSGTCNPDNNFSGCFVINDFHGKTAERTLTRVQGGVSVDITYNVTDITVEYVAETSPYAPSGTQTYAKKVTLNVSTPVLVDADGAPFEVPMSRIYMYPNF